MGVLSYVNTLKELPTFEESLFKIWFIYLMVKVFYFSYAFLGWSPIFVFGCHSFNLINRQSKPLSRLVSRQANRV